jgi:hypothetical protein
MAPALTPTVPDPFVTPEIAVAYAPTGSSIAVAIANSTKKRVLLRVIYFPS